MLIAIRWIFTVATVAVFAWSAAFHARNIIGFWITGRSLGSNVPLVGGVCGVVAMLIVPLDVRPWWWLPLVVDLGTGFYVLFVLGWLTMRGIAVAVRWISDGISN